MRQEKTFQWNSRDYAQHSSAQQEWAQELIARLNLSGNESILDIGCGDGKVTAQIAGELPRGTVVGIDSSENMISFAKEKYPESEFSNLVFEQMDATELDFENRFDLAFSNAALHWVKDHPAVLRGVKRALKPRGKILFQMGGEGNAAEIIRILQINLKKNEWQPYFTDFTFPYRFYSPVQYREWLRILGFIASRVEIIPKQMRHQNKTALVGWIRTTWLPYTRRIPAHLRDKFIEEIAETYLKYIAWKPGKQILVQMVRLEVEAQKK